MVLLDMIQDEFSNLPITRQRKEQLRHVRDGKCQYCSNPLAKESTLNCVTHMIKIRERQRKNRGRKKRYLGSRSYKVTMV
jgi:hypothetical protein